MAKIVKVEIRAKNTRTGEKKVRFIDLTAEGGMLTASNLLSIMTFGAELWRTGWDVSEFDIDRVHTRDE